jgi:tryptophan synthase alpha chain
MIYSIVQNNNNLQDNRLVKRFCELCSESEPTALSSSSVFSKSSRKKNDHLLICYAVAGYPDIDTTKEIISIMIQAGADIIEIGVPFSDPIADGPIIQEASYLALQKGITPDKSLEIAKDIRKEFPKIPIVLMTYSNILSRAGFNKFIKKAKQCGVDGFILPDMSIEESGKYVKEASQLNLATIFLVSPNTKKKRLLAIASKSSGFLYLVSVYGTTGIRKSFEDSTASYIKNTKRTIGSSLPVAVGFGISKPEHVKFMINAGADAIIVASAIINIMKVYTSDIKNTKKKKEMMKSVSNFVSSMKSACRV